MKGTHRNDQLERFFQHQPFEDPLYLKRYVKEHPDHKMAWYLLGREYAAKGKEGKAAYCFAQSGEIYEAFERQKIVVEGPLPPFTSAAGEAPAHAAAGKKSKTAVIRAWALWLALLLFLVLPASFDQAALERAEHSAFTVEQPSAPMGVRGGGAVDASPAANMKIHFAGGDWMAKVGSIIAASKAGGRESILVGASSSSDGKWLQWNKPLQLLLGVENSGGSDYGAVLRYYSSQVCSCQLSDGSRMTPIIQRWMRSSEQAIVLNSAIEAYQSKFGGLPERVEQLAAPYPDNILPGVTADMQVMFPRALEKAAGSRAPAAPVEAAAGDAAQPAESQAPADQDNPAGSPAEQAATSPFQEPVRIVIDTDRHQLALVSGNMILRSYPVGLGGDKTPQGDFVISEKVRNPNGKSNGEFGSRGMTLSDTLYAIHGTNKPPSIGKDESHGCVRMKQADVEELYDMVPQMTKVTIGKGVLPSGDPGDSNPPEGEGAGRGNPGQAFGLPLQTKDSNPNKTYKWLD